MSNPTARRETSASSDGGLVFNGTSERAFHMTTEITLEKTVGYRSAIQLDEIRDELDAEHRTRSADPILSSGQVLDRGSVEESLGQLHVAGHSDPGIGIECFADQCPRSFAVPWSGAVDQHHSMEAAYLGLLDQVRKGFRVLHRDLKMLFGGVPLARGPSRDAGDGLRES
jgi:hypothetical protein